MSDVHSSDYGDGRSIRVLCTQAWHSPAWKQPEELQPGPYSNATGIYATDDGTLYTFDSPKVTCQKCKEPK